MSLRALVVMMLALCALVRPQIASASSMCGPETRYRVFDLAHGARIGVRPPQARERIGVSRLRTTKTHQTYPLALWTSADPAFEDFLGDGRIFVPARLAVFSYSLNSPVWLRDPDGRDVIPITPAAAAEFARDVLATTTRVGPPVAAAAARTRPMGPVQVLGMAIYANAVVWPNALREIDEIHGRTGFVADPIDPSSVTWPTWMHVPTPTAPSGPSSVASPGGNATPATSPAPAAPPGTLAAGGGGGGGGEPPIRLRHFTNALGFRGIQESRAIRPRDQNSVFAVRAQGPPGSPREVEARLRIGIGRGHYYVDFDARRGEYEVVRNPRTQVTEYVFRGRPVSLEGRNAEFRRNR